VTELELTEELTKRIKFDPVHVWEKVRLEAPLTFPDDVASNAILIF